MRPGAAVAALLLATACAATRPTAPPAPPPARCEGAPPTYAADVRAILERRCFACHAGEGPAAEEHDFSRVDTLRAQRRQLTDAVAQRAMPPAGRPPLSDAEAATLLRWAACGGS
jgi:uncharacterized membrane protein